MWICCSLSHPLATGTKRAKDLWSKSVFPKLHNQELMFSLKGKTNCVLLFLLVLFQCIVGELAGEGSVAVAVGIGDR